MSKLFPFILGLITLFSTASLNAQPQHLPPTNSNNTSGSVFGSIIDENSKPIEFASIFVKQVTDSATVQVGVTDNEGKFMINEIPFGEYFLEIQFVGYRKHYTSPFIINSEKSTFRLPKFKLSNHSTALKTVEVKAQKDMLQTNLDKTVYNVESSIVADGASAVEVLEEIPSVDVDLEGNVTLRGSENVTILVDGRPTNLTLDQIPSSQIESIEVITNPSARLEPDGMAGILNVVLKKKKEAGINGMISLGGDLSLFQQKAYFNHYNGNFNLNYSYNKINIFANYSIRQFGHNNAGEMERDSWFGTDTTHLTQDNMRQMSGLFHNVNAGLDWFINKQNTLSFNFGYQVGNRSDTNDLYSNNSNIINGEYIPYSIYNQNGKNSGSNNNINASINYKKTFITKGQELTADVYFTQREGDNMNWYLQKFDYPSSSPNYYQRTQSIDLNRNANAQLDFVTPVGNGGRIETGYKFSYRSVGQDYSLFYGNDSQTIFEDTTQTNNFIYSEFINAAYFIYSNTFWKKLKLQLGLRGELANTVSDLQSADTVYNNQYFNLFPTLHVVYDFNKNHALQLSYSRRVSRPRIMQLNPFVDISDKQNLRKGNPNLTPEFANSLELAYLLNIDKSSFSLTAFYRQRNDLITRYTEIFEEEIDDQMYTYTMTTYENLNKSQNYGIEIFYGQRFWKFWKLNLTGNFYRNIIDSDSLIDENLSNDWAWGFRLNQTFSLPKEWDIQLNFRYRSPTLTTGSMGWGTGGVGQGRRSAHYTLNMGIKKSFFNKTFIVSLNLRDILYSMRTKVHTYSTKPQNGYDAYSIREGDGFRISLNLSYKINNYKKRPEKTIGEGEEMEGME